MNIETVGLDLCMPCHPPAQNEFCCEFCLYCFMQSALENLQGLELLHLSEQSVLLLDLSPDS